MKKNFFKALFVLMCGCAMTTGFVACGSDDDNSSSTTPGQQDEQPGDDQEDEDWGKVQNGIVEYSAVATNYNLLHQISADDKIMVKYLDGNGEVKTEEFTGEFSKSVSLTANNEELRAAIMVYVENVDSAKMAAVIGKAPMGVKVSGKAVLNFENKKNYAYNIAASKSTSFKEFSEDLVPQAMTSLMREILVDKRKYGVYNLGSFDHRVGATTSTGDKFWRIDQ